LHKYKKVSLAVIVLVIFSGIGVCPSTYARGKKSDHTYIQIPCEAALLMEYVSAKVLYAKNPHKQWPPASMTKMMLMLIVMEKIKEGSVKLDDKITISALASKMGGSQVYLKEGEVFTLKELMKAIVIHSANDAAVAVAEYLAGSPEGFVDMMNQRAEELGLRDTRYHSVHGLPPGPGQEEDLTSAYDAALLGRELIKYPLILQWGATPRDSFRSGQFILYNTNKLIGRVRGVDGIKTGFYQKAGFNVTATAQRNGMRFIAVILGAATSEQRFAQASRLLNIGFNNYKRVTVIKAGDPLGKLVKVRGGKISTVQPRAGKDVTVLVKKAQEKDIEIRPIINDPLIAPLKKGDQIGIVIIKAGDEFLAKAPAITGEEIPQANLFWRLVPIFQ
jgi:D-alanyl-D-alanine carboxypeptidase (penicillin-binding protein 5/6)